MSIEHQREPYPLLKYERIKSLEPEYGNFMKALSEWHGVYQNLLQSGGRLEEKVSSIFTFPYKDQIQIIALGDKVVEEFLKLINKRKENHRKQKGPMHTLNLEYVRKPVQDILTLLDRIGKDNGISTVFTLQVGVLAKLHFGMEERILLEQHLQEVISRLVEEGKMDEVGRVTTMHEKMVREIAKNLQLGEARVLFPENFFNDLQGRRFAKEFYQYFKSQNTDVEHEYGEKEGVQSFDEELQLDICKEMVLWGEKGEETFEKEITFRVNGKERYEAFQSEQFFLEINQELKKENSKWTTLGVAGKEWAQDLLPKVEGTQDWYPIHIVHSARGAEMGEIYEEKEGRYNIDTHNVVNTRGKVEEYISGEEGYFIQTYLYYPKMDRIFMPGTPFITFDDIFRGTPYEEEGKTIKKEILHTVYVVEKACYDYHQRKEKPQTPEVGKDVSRVLEEVRKKYMQSLPSLDPQKVKDVLDKLGEVEQAKGSHKKMKNQENGGQVRPLTLGMNSEFGKNVRSAIGGYMDSLQLPEEVFWAIYYNKLSAREVLMWMGEVK